ncbi:hypothetical protein ARTHROSP310_36410 [Arthrobacter sp. AD-310]
MPGDVDLLCVLDYLGKIKPVYVRVCCCAPGGGEGVVDAASGRQAHYARGRHGPGNMDKDHAGCRIPWQACPCGIPGFRILVLSGVILPGVILSKTVRPGRFGTAGAWTAQRQDLGPAGGHLPPEQCGGKQGGDTQQGGDPYTKPPAHGGPRPGITSPCRIGAVHAAGVAGAGFLRRPVDEVPLPGAGLQQTRRAAERGLQPGLHMARGNACCSSVPA